VNPVKKAIEWGKRAIQRFLQPILWSCYHPAGGPDAGWPTEREVTMSNVKREISGEYSQREDYQHLPPWQWTSVADIREMEITFSNRLPSGGESQE
jgi:hypothetical protein